MEICPCSPCEGVWGSRGITPLLPWYYIKVTTFSLQPLYSRERTTVRIELESGWTRLPVLTFMESSKLSYSYRDLYS